MPTGPTAPLTDSAPDAAHERPRRVLVTGARGFVGRACVELLGRRGWEVHATSTRETPENASASDAEIHWWQADLLDHRASRALLDRVRPTHLLHLAWVADRRTIYTSMDNYRWVAASLELVRAFAEAGGQRVVAIGSGAEYDWSAGQCTENQTPLRPTSTYGLCKRTLSELFVDLVSREDQALTGAWARLFFLYGPHEHPKRLIAWVITQLLAGEVAPCSHGRQQRDFLFVLDAADALVTLLDSQVGGTINIASGEAVALGDLIHQVADRLGGRERVALGAIPVPADDPPLVVADVRRLRDELGWRPRWTHAEALAHTIDWWRQQTRAEAD